MLWCNYIYIAIKNNQVYWRLTYGRALVAVTVSYARKSEETLWKTFYAN